MVSDLPFERFERFERCELYLFLMKTKCTTRQELPTGIKQPVTRQRIFRASV